MLTEDIKPGWLWLLGASGAALIVLAVVADLVLGLENILPNVALTLGAGSLLFSLLFFLERRIVRRLSLVWVSGLEEWLTRTGQDPQVLAAHLAGPVAAVQDFVDAIVVQSDFRAAWQLADENWRLCRAQAWLWNNRHHPLVKPFDLDGAAFALATAESDHPLWSDFSEIELSQFREAWREMDLANYGAASATRRVEDGEIVLLIDISEHPDGAMVDAATQVNGVPFLVRQVGENWRVANHAGDHLPLPGWPPDWREGWTYWEKYLAE